MSRARSWISVFALVCIASAGPQSDVTTFTMRDGSEWRTSPTDVPWAIQEDNARFRFEVRYADRSDYDIGARHTANRAEITGQYELPMKRPIRFGFDLRVADGPPITSKWLNLGQARPTLDKDVRGISPFWQQTLTDGNVFKILVRSSTRKNLDKSPAPQVLFTDPKFERGKTYRFRYRMVYDPAGQGELDVWRNDKQIVSYRGPLGYDTVRGPYLKLGIYRAPAPETVVAYYSNVFVNFDDCPDPANCTPARKRFH